MAVENKLHWKFPSSEFVILRIELLFIIILGIIIFFVSYIGLAGQWLPALLFTICFFALYIIVSVIVQKIRGVEEYYHLNPTHIEITRKVRTGTKKEKIHFKDIKHHKLDKNFLGGYLLTHRNKKHVLFFNTKKEIELFEKFIKKHLKK